MLLPEQSLSFCVCTTDAPVSYRIKAACLWRMQAVDSRRCTPSGPGHTRFGHVEAFLGQGGVSHCALMATMEGMMEVGLWECYRK